MSDVPKQIRDQEREAEQLRQQLYGDGSETEGGEGDNAPADPEAQPGPKSKGAGDGTPGDDTSYPNSVGGDPRDRYSGNCSPCSHVLRWHRKDRCESSERHQYRRTRRDRRFGGSGVERARFSRHGRRRDARRS